MHLWQDEMIEPHNLEKAILREAAVRIQDLLRVCLPDNYIFGNLYGAHSTRQITVFFSLGTDLKRNKWSITLQADQISINESHSRPTTFGLADPDCFDKVVDFILVGEDLV